MPSFNPNIIGGVEIGIILSIFLHGMVTVQAYIYFRNFPRDSKSLKSVVAVLWVADLGHVICTTFGIYKMTITDYGLPPNLVALPNSFPVAVGFGAIVHPLVQGTFIVRIYQFSKQLSLVGLCSVLAAFNVVSSFVFMCTILSFSHVLTMEVMEKYEEEWSWLIHSIFASTAVLDVMIAASLCYFLVKQRSVTSKSTASLIDAWILWTVETGLITSLTAIAIVICFATMRSNNAWLALWMAITALYPISLLAALNGRLELTHSEPVVLGSIQISHETHTYGDPPFTFGRPGTGVRPSTGKRWYITD